MSDVITFLEEEMPEGDVIHISAIYVSAHYFDMCIPLILMDNGFALNIYTKDTLGTLGIPLENVWPNPCE